MSNTRLFNYVDTEIDKKELHTASPDSITTPNTDQITINYFGAIAAALIILVFSLIWQSVLFSSFSPIVSGSGYVAIGLILVAIFSKHSDTKATFLLSFSLCSMVATIAQSYSLATFSTPASTLDANTFLKLITSRIDMNLQEMKTVVNAPLAVVTWQFLIGIWSKIGVPGGLWIAVQFNALLVALSTSITMGLARLLIGDNTQKLRYGVYLFPLCGIHLLFGSILIRDSFALFFNIVALYSLAKFLTYPNAVQFSFALLVNVICGSAMYFIREQSIYLYMLFFVSALGVSMLSGRISMGKISILCLIGAILLLGSVQMASTMKNATNETDQKSSSYEGGSVASNREGSLGVSLIVNQPAPIKAIAGSLYLFVQPIPLWGYFQYGLDEYLWIKGYQGLFAVVIFPSLILGTLLCTRGMIDQGGKTALGRFLVLYLILSTVLVALTSFETRHHGQFFPAYLVLALAGMQPVGGSVVTLSWLRISWLTTIILGHVAWWILRL